MKAKREHRVPLSGRVLAVLAEAWMLTDESGLVFPNAKGRQLTRGALGRVLRRCGIDGTTHGFRSSFRDYCAETEVDRAVAEASLAFTGKHLNESKRMPTSLRVSVALCEVERKSLEKTPNGRKETELRPPLLRSCEIDVPLYEDGTPRWKEHPTLGRICDVVALDIDSEYHSLMTRLNPKGYHTVPGTTCEPFSTWVDRRDDMTMAVQQYGILHRLSRHPWLVPLQ